MWVNPKEGKIIPKSKIKKHVLKSIADYNQRYPRNKMHIAEFDIDIIVEQFHDLNKNLKIASKDRKNNIFAVCEKNPPNLDTGKHHYSIMYIKDGSVKTLRLFEFNKLFNTSCNDRKRGLPYWTYCSGAIGMSRVLDATDGPFVWLQRIGGYYAQIEVL